jgi:hypothetical protein
MSRLSGDVDAVQGLLAGYIGFCWSEYLKTYIYYP